MKRIASGLPFFAVIGIFTMLVMIIGVLAVTLLIREAPPAPVETPPPTVVKATEITVTSTPAATCGNRGTLKVLLIGADFSKGVWPKGADAVRLVQVNFDDPKITIVSFPRDLWLKTPALASDNVTETRLGLAYYYKKSATMGSEKDRDTAASILVGQTLYDNFGIAPDKYLTIQLDNMGDMVNAIGGVTVTVPAAFTSDYKIFFPAGAQKLNGAQASEFVRTYNPGGDAARIQRQNLFAKALQDQLLNTGTLLKLPALIQPFNNAIATDLDPKLISDLVCMADLVPEDQVDFHEINGDLVSSRNIGERVPVLDPVMDKVNASLEQWFGN